MINAPATRVEDGMPASVSATLEPFPLTAGWLACSHKDFDSERRRLLHTQRLHESVGS